MLSSAIASAIANSHTHANKALLDTYTQTDANIASAVSLKHSHANKTLLDTYTQTEANLASAVSLKHTHSNKTLLDSLTSAGAGTSFLADDGTYKVVVTTPSWGSITGTLSAQTDLNNALTAKAPTTAATISASSESDALTLQAAYDRRALYINPSVARTNYGVVQIKDDGTAANNGFRASLIIQGADNASALQPNLYLYNYSATPAISLLIDHNNTANPAIKVNKANVGDVAIEIGKGTLKFGDGTIQSTAAV